MRTTDLRFSDVLVICSGGNIWMHSTKRYKFSAFLQVQFPMLKSHPCERQTFHKFLLKFMIISRAALSFPTLLQIDYLKIKNKEERVRNCATPEKVHSNAMKASSGPVDPFQKSWFNG